MVKSHKRNWLVLAFSLWSSVIYCFRRQEDNLKWHFSSAWFFYTDEGNYLNPKWSFAELSASWCFCVCVSNLLIYIEQYGRSQGKVQMSNVFEKVLKILFWYINRPIKYLVFKSLLTEHFRTKDIVVYSQTSQIIIRICNYLFFIFYLQCSLMC